MKQNICDLKCLEIELHKKVARNYDEIREKNRASAYHNNYWAYRTLSMIRKNPKHILDLGCGTGRLYPHVMKMFPYSSYTGVDISNDMLAIARKRFKGHIFLQGDCENLRFKKNSFDAVVVWGSLHHLPNPRKGLAEIRRVLAKNGILIISEPTSNILISKVRKMFYGAKKYHFSPSHKAFMHSELINMIINSGFRIKKIRFFGLMAFLFSFPDIIPATRHLPLSFMKKLVHIDELLLKLPFIRSFRFATIILAEKIS